MNRKYRLENQKLSKDYTQDFLEDYKTKKDDPHLKSQKKKLIKKVYESDN